MGNLNNGNDIFYEAEKKPKKSNFSCRDMKFKINHLFLLFFSHTFYIICHSEPLFCVFFSRFYTRRCIIMSIMIAHFICRNASIRVLLRTLFIPITYLFVALFNIKTALICCVINGSNQRSLHITCLLYMNYFAF